MAEADATPPVISPDTAARDMSRKLRRVDAECERRIQALYPAQEQTFLLAVIVAGLAGVAPADEIRGVASEGYIVAREKARARDMISAMIAHRHAAEALKLMISRNPLQMQAIDVAAPKYWPPSKGRIHEG